MPNVTVYVVTNWQNLPTKTSPIDSVNLNHLETGVKNVTDFLNTINAENGLYLCATPFLNADRTKLDGIEAQANKYVLPTASNVLLGGVKVDGITITIDQNGVISSVASSTSLENLTDVDLDNLSDGQILKYDSASSKWVNATNEAVTTLANLTDTQIANPSDGQILKYDATSGKWINDTGGGGVGDLDDLGDVEITSPIEGQYLRYDETEEKWINDDGVEELSYNETLTILGEPEIEPAQGLTFKSFTYTGDGNINHNLTLPEIPKMILSITSEDASGFKVGTASIVWGAPAGLVYWTNNSGRGSNPMLLSYNSNTITIVGVDAGQSLNVNGATYTVYYI